MIDRVAAVWLSWVILFSCIVIIVDIAEPVNATTIYVDDSGGADFFTITMAINAASDGDTVYVYSGTYYEHVVVDKTINLTGENRDTTTINGQGVGDVVYISANWVNISGFSLIDSGPNGIPADAGIDVGTAQNVSISDNFFSLNHVAIYLDNSNDSIVANNVIDDFTGIDIPHSRNITISGNTISTQYDGIDLGNSILCKISDNTMTDTGFEFSGNSIEYWSTHDIDTSNTVNGDPVYYWANKNSGTVPSGAGQVILANCTNVIVENQHITDGYIGIILGFSYYNLIRNNNASSNHENGLYLLYSNNNTIEDNIFIDSMNGIYFSFSNGNNITGNYVSDHGGGLILGSSYENIIYDNIFFDNLFGLMLILSQGNIISDNNFTYNWAGPGVFIASSSDNIISNNILFENKEGINVSDFFNYSSNNKVFHNSLIGNSNQAYDDTLYENYWDNGYPSGGNYWDDYSGADTKNGPSQDISGGDGIGDSPYEIEIDTFDNYPLMEPWGIDSTAPSIELISPSDYSFIDIGTKINLSVSDLNLEEVTYSINDGGYQILSSPYDIDTGNWNDGDYKVEVQAKDTSDNEKTVVYHFYVDMNPPTITLNSPGNNSMINAGSLIEFTISDANIDEVTYTKNSGVPTSLYQPYTINPYGWSDGDYIVTVYADDKAGNTNERWYKFILDKTFPQITLNSPVNGSILQDSSLDFEISDEHLNSAEYKINQGTLSIFEAPYDLDTSEWEDGEYRITIKADDSVGNTNEKWFLFKKDSTSPSIVSISPNDNSIDILVDENIVIDFSESMDTESVESAISISPYTEYSCSWSNDNKTLTIAFSELLEYETLYQISISTQASDMADNGLEDKFELEFTTVQKPKEKDGEEFPVMFLLLMIIMAIIVAVVIVIMVMAKKKKLSSEMVEPVVGIPDVIQIRCSNCNNILSVNDIGTTQNVSCPYCSTTSTVHSRRVAPQMAVLQTQPQSQLQPQTQPISIQISCPQCLYNFSVMKTQGSVHVQCPNCGVKGTMG
jgi:parallel beta-helix repeat protein